MASWRHHERTRPGPAAAQRHGRGLGLTELLRRLPSRCAGAQPLKPRCPSELGCRRHQHHSAREGGSGRREGTAQAATAAEARSWTLAPAPPTAGLSAPRPRPRPYGNGARVVSWRRHRGPGGVSPGCCRRAEPVTPALGAEHGDTVVTQGKSGVRKKWSWAVEGEREAGARGRLGGA